MSDVTQRYRDFFKESLEGQAFIEKLEFIIDQEHERSENSTDPNASFAHTQRAKGVRDVIAAINALTSGVKKGNNSGM